MNATTSVPPCLPVIIIQSSLQPLSSSKKTLAFLLDKKPVSMLLHISHLLYTPCCFNTLNTQLLMPKTRSHHEAYFVVTFPIGGHTIYIIYGLNGIPTKFLKLKWIRLKMNECMLSIQTMRDDGFFSNTHFKKSETKLKESSGILINQIFLKLVLIFTSINAGK